VSDFLTNICFISHVISVIQRC